MTHSGNVIERKLEMKNKEIQLIQHAKWPEKGQPNSTDGIVHLIERVITSNASNITVHCTDGIGRSGVFLALLSMAIQVKNKESQISVFDTVFKLRSFRPGMVII